MKNSIIVIMASAVLALSLAGCETMSRHKQETGIIAGGAAGGIIGNALTGGSGVGTGVGAVGGALIGNEIGKNMK